MPPCPSPRRPALPGTLVALVVLLVAACAGLAPAPPAAHAAGRVQRSAVTAVAVARRAGGHRLALRFSAPVAPGRRGWLPRVVSATGRALPARLAGVRGHRT